MTTINRQRGMSALGILFVLLVASFVLTCVIKLLPHYMDSWTLNSAISKSVENNQYKGMSSGEIRSKVGKYLDINRLEVIKAKDIKIKREKGITYIDASYEKRVPLMFNVDVVMKFDQLQYEFPTQ